MVVSTVRGQEISRNPISVASARSAHGVVAQSVANPAVHYTFDTDLLDVYSNSTLTVASACPVTNGPCNSASSFGEDSDGKYWTWTSTDSRGGGFTIETNALIGNSYTIALKFSFSQVSGWRKIIDYKNRVSDDGFYYFGGKMQFYPGLTGATTYPANTVLDLVVVRQATTGNAGTFTVFGVGADNTLTQLIQYDDSNGDSIPHDDGTKTKLGFFFDDMPTSAEATPSGKVYDLRIWRNTSLSTSDLNNQVVRPVAPTGIAVDPATGAVTVSWSPVSNATSYTASAGGQSCTVAAPATSCIIGGLTDGQQVTATVQASGPGGLSGVASAANPVTVGAVSSTTTSTTPGTLTTSSTLALTTSTTLASTTSTVVSEVEEAPAPDVDGDELPSTGPNSRWFVVVLVLVALGLVSRRFSTSQNRL